MFCASRSSYYGLDFGLDFVPVWNEQSSEGEEDDDEEEEAASTLALHVKYQSSTADWQKFSNSERNARL